MYIQVDCIQVLAFLIFNLANTVRSFEAIVLYSELKRLHSKKKKKLHHYMSDSPAVGLDMEITYFLFLLYCLPEFLSGHGLDHTKNNVFNIFL